MRFYGFQAGELTTTNTPNLDLRIDPKLGWALRNRHLFPVHLDSAPRHMLLRVPGLGVKNVDRILQARRWSKVRLADLLRLRVPMKKAMPFIETSDHKPRDLENDGLIERFAGPAEQLDLFAAPEASVYSGQL